MQKLACACKIAMIDIDMKIAGFYCAPLCDVLGEALLRPVSADGAEMWE